MLSLSSSGPAEAKFDPGFILSAALGYHGPWGLNLEAEYAYRNNSLKNVRFGRSYPIRGTFETSSYMANLVCDLPTRWTICAFVGAGAGYDCQHIRISTGRYTFTSTKNGFAWQIIIGAAYRLYEYLDISLEYKLHNGPSKHIFNNSVGIGLIYDFSNLRFK
jgi:opacity protein-like surface antigen